MTHRTPVKAVIVGGSVVALSEFEAGDTIPLEFLPVLGSSGSFFSKTSYDSPCFIKTGYSTLSVKAGTGVNVDGDNRKFSVDTAIGMPALVAGSDYSVWVRPDGVVVAVADPYSAPASAPVAGSVKIGGFHYGLIAPGTTVAGGGFSTTGVTNAGGSMAWTQAMVDKLAGINEYSLWDLSWFCRGEQRGMAYDPYKQVWAGIYLCGTNHHINGVSAYNTDVASGSVLPKIPVAYGGNGALTYAAFRVYEAHEILASHGLRLPTYEEFMGFAFGVTEGQAIGGAGTTIPSTKREPGYTSRIGIEQATGNAWAFGGPIVSTAGTTFASNGRGSWLGTTGLVLLGGARSSGADSGSRCASFTYALTLTNWSVSMRAVGDHMRPVGVPR